MFLTLFTLHVSCIFNSDSLLPSIFHFSSIGFNVTESKSGFNPDKVHFVTDKSKEYKGVYDAAKQGWTLTVLGSDANDGQYLYVVQEESSGKYATLARLNIYSYEPKSIKVKLVPVNGFTNNFSANNVSTQLNSIYNKVGITCVVEMAGSFDYEPLKTNPFNVTGSGLFSTLTDDMKALNSAYQTANPEETAICLFIIENVTGNENVAGDMPRGKQFGYLFNGATVQTIAHEIGHGIFHLDHPFDRANAAKSFTKGDLADNLMEYSGGSDLVKLQWDAIHSPGLVIGLFETDEGGMQQGNNAPEYLLEAYKHLNAIGETIKENKFVIFFSTTCFSANNINEDVSEIVLNVNAETYQIINETNKTIKAVTYSYKGRINIALSVETGNNNVDYTYNQGIKVSEVTEKGLIEINSGTFFGLLTNDSIYQCEPPKNSICEEGWISDNFYDEMVTAILNCLKNNEQNSRSNKVGDSFFYKAITQYPDVDKDTLRKIADKYDRIADILFNGQSGDNEWNRYGDYFEASFQAAQQANNIDNGDFLKRMDGFIRIFENKLSQLNSIENDKIALFVGTFSDMELMYLPMKLRINTLDILAQSPELKNLLDPLKRDATITNWAMRENMILKLLQQIEPGEEKELLNKLRTSNVIKAINDNLDDFITLVDDNYTKFLDIIDGYIYHINIINENTRDSWLQKLYDENKIFNLNEITKEGERFISATEITYDANVKLQLETFSGEYKTDKFYYEGGSFDIKTPIYSSENINIAYDQPIVIYHNAYLSGVSPDKMGEMQIASALRAHYYLQKHKDAVTGEIIWSTIDVATFFVGVGEISVAVKAAKGWRLALGICNTASSVGSLLATVSESYLINQYGKEGEEYVRSMRIVSSVLGVADLGASGITKFKNMLNDDLVTIGRFHKKFSQQLAADAKTQELERITKKLVDDFDEDLVRQIENVSQITETISDIKRWDVAGEFAKGKNVVEFTIEWGGKSYKLKWTKESNGLINFGDRTDLAKILGTSDNIEAHHIIPWAKGEHDVIQAAAKDGFHLNIVENGIGLEKYTKLTGEGLHGNHPAYDKFIQNKLDEFVKSNLNYSSQQANKFVQEQLIPELKTHIVRAKQSDLNLNEYFK
ncbi:MAG: AHH domain-containing protein, partial [Candidatus Symbiothrix sp.]|nr:AHH domain-containing protein [Candidatus Symbiothrix sp.]